MTKRNKQLICIGIILFLFGAIMVISALTGNVGQEQEATTDAELSNNTPTTHSTTVVPGVTSDIDATLVTGENGENDTLIAATVKRVVNEKVIEVAIDDNTIEVALIGVEVPEVQKQSTIEHLKNILPTNTEVWLQYDESTTNDEGQELCYIWLSNQVNFYSYTACQNKMLQGILISNGLAEPSEEYPNSRYEVQFNLMKEG